MNGSIRQRSAGSWELRAYVGVDPATGRSEDRHARRPSSLLPATSRFDDQGVTNSVREPVEKSPWTGECVSALSWLRPCSPR